MSLCGEYVMEVSLSLRNIATLSENRLLWIYEYSGNLKLHVNNTTLVILLYFFCVGTNEWCHAIYYIERTHSRRAEFVEEFQSVKPYNFVVLFNLTIYSATISTISKLENLLYIRSCFSAKILFKAQWHRHMYAKTSFYSRLVSTHILEVQKKMITSAFLQSFSFSLPLFRRLHDRWL